MEKDKQIIVKVQLPLSSSGPCEVLVYSKNKLLEFVIEPDAAELKVIKKAMKGEDKAFFYACEHCEQVLFDEPAPDQNW